jgi:hypothetical protein
MFDVLTSLGHSPGTNDYVDTFYRHVHNKEMQEVPIGFITICLLAYNSAFAQCIFITFYIDIFT